MHVNLCKCVLLRVIALAILTATMEFKPALMMVQVMDLVSSTNVKPAIIVRTVRALRTCVIPIRRLIVLLAEAKEHKFVMATETPGAPVKSQAAKKAISWSMESANHLLTPVNQTVLARVRHLQRTDSR